LPYVAEVAPGQELGYRLLLRNNLGRPASYGARLLPPSGWGASPEFRTLELDAGARGELALSARAPGCGDNTRRLLAAEVRLDGQTLGPVSEALVTVRDRGAGPAARPDFAGK
jgi:hypothetical protein